MAKYRKVPVEIEAVQYKSDGGNWKEVGEFGKISVWKTCYPPLGVIKTLEGEMLLRPGDWLIKGVAGEFYPCKPDIFAKTYEPAD